MQSMVMPTAQKPAAEKNTNWEITSNRFVAFLDILGFKDRVLRSSHDEVLKLLYETSDQIQEMDHMQRKLRVNGESISNLLLAVTFSDTIVLITRDDTYVNYATFISLLVTLFSNLMDSGIPIKGAISHGLISVDQKRNIYFGQAFIDAALLHEDVQYMGVVAHHSIEKYMSELDKDAVSEKVFFEGKTPMKSGFYRHMNLDWTLMKTEIHEVNNPYLEILLPIMAQFKTTMSGGVRKYIDNTIEIFSEYYKSEAR